MNKRDEHPILKRELTLGQRLADKVTLFVGSWKFIILVLLYIGLWITLNLIGFFYHWDPWPFILLNLTLSFLAVLQAPIILMSQNRTAERDRITAKYDYQVDKKAEKEIEEIQKDLKEIKRLLKKR